MLYYDRIEFSEGIDVNKISVSKECDINDVKNLSDIAILNIKGSDNRCIISLISKNKAVNYYKMLIWLKKVEYYKT